MNSAEGGKQVEREFDPEHIGRYFDARDKNGDLYLASSNYEMEDGDERGTGWVAASDYDQLLALYRAASTPEAAGLSEDIPAEDQKRVDELMVYAWITNGTLLHNPHQMARIVREIREEGISGVMSIRCMEHRAIPQLNNCEASGAECGACVAMGQTPAPPSGEQTSIAENGRLPNFKNEEKLKDGQQGGASENG